MYIRCRYNEKEKQAEAGEKQNEKNDIDWKSDNHFFNDDATSGISSKRNN